jgi:outer membrane receptor for ferrienterochelin and colicin
LFNSFFGKNLTIAILSPIMNPNRLRMKRVGSVLASLILVLVSTVVLAQTSSISGKVRNASGVSLGRLSVQIKGTTVGTTTDDNGNFTLAIPSSTKYPFTLVVSGVGAISQEIVVKSASDIIDIEVLSATSLSDEIVVSATRTQTRALESPVTIERVGLNTIRNAPAANYYDIIGNVKGVDLVTSSLTFKTVTTRGFAGSGNTRFNQIMDGMDNQAPGLNFSVGSIIGLTELDVESMELLPGASSALYGPGGMNGTLLINSKSPFKYEGLSFQSKVGMMHTDGRYREPSPYYNVSLRYAKKISEKLAFKVGAELIHAKDWLADDQRNYIRPTATNGLTVGQFGDGTRESDPNYNGANSYGDETSIPSATNTFILGAIGAAVPPISGFINGLIAEGVPAVSRTGYREELVADPNTINAKISGSLNYKINNNLELVLAGYWGNGNTIYTGSDRYSLKDFKIGQYKLELLSKNWMVRAYTTQEDAGQSHNLTAASRITNERLKPSATWIQEYWQSYVNSRMSGQNGYDAHNTARAFSDRGLPVPGSDAFKAVYDQVIRTPIKDGGALFLDKTNLYAIEGQYNLAEYTKKVADILIGGNFRQFRLNSQGTLFIDTAGPIPINEWGIYAQAGRNFGERVRIIISGRYDKNENFAGRVTPRATAVIKVAKNNNIRVSYQTAYRFPSTQQQYIRLGVGGGETLLGGLPVFAEIYNFAGNPPVDLPLSSPTNPKVSTFNEFKPESVQSIELGYKGLVANDKLLIDVYGYLGEYTNFIVRRAVAQKINPSLGYTASNLQTLSIPVNSTAKVKTYGAGFSLEYRMARGYFATLNATTDVLQDVPEGFVAFFNAPQYRYNIGFGNNGFGKDKRLGFNIVYRWQDSFMYESDFVSGEVPAFHNVDAQVSYKFPAIKSLIGLGAMNILNQYYITAPGNPSVGGMYYVRFAYNIF